jgi:phospholipid N-methyltransferase
MSVANWTFFRAFVKAPRVVAAALPSSAALERRVLRAMQLSPDSVVVEFGTGTGGITRATLAALGPEGRLLAIEWTAEFVETVRKIDDARLDVIHGCASTIREELANRGLSAADVVVSGIPFSTMPPELCQKIASELFAALKPGGRFVAYQFTDRVVDYTTPHMGPPNIQHEILNIPPMRVFSWQKAEAASGHNNVAAHA